MNLPEYCVKPACVHGSKTALTGAVDFDERTIKFMDWHCVKSNSLLPLQEYMLILRRSANAEIKSSDVSGRNYGFAGWVTDIMIINNIEIIAATILPASFAGYIVWRSRRKKRIARTRAAVVFRNKILAELQGLYPVPRRLKDDVFSRFRESIPGIEAAAAEFRHFVPTSSKNSFDIALKNYCEHCNKITWGSCVTFNIMPGEGKPEDIGPKEIFRQNVNALLFFAKET